MDEGIQEVGRLGRFKIYQDTSSNEVLSPITGKVIMLEPDIYVPYEIIFKKEQDEKENH